VRLKPLMFDLDGTLFQAHKLSLTAYGRTFEKLLNQGLCPEMPRESVLKKTYGMTEKEIWTMLLPSASPEVQKMAARWTEQGELENLRQGQGELYPRALATLQELKARGHGLYIVSNGGRDYVKAVCDAFCLTPLLSGIYSAGQYGTDSKSQLLELAVRREHLNPGMMIGDRGSDVAAGKDNGFMTVGCCYGYGHRDELQGADFLIDDISQVVAVVSREPVA
jgi:phosphoglycolate phosphatase